MELKHDQVDPSPDVELGEQIGDVEFGRPFRNVEFFGDLFIREVFEQALEHFALSRAQVARASLPKTAPGAVDDRVHKSGEQMALHPEASRVNRLDGVRQVLRCLRIIQQPLGPQFEHGESIGVSEFFGNSCRYLWNRC